MSKELVELNEFNEALDAIRVQLQTESDEWSGEMESTVCGWLIARAMKLRIDLELLMIACY